MPFNLLCFCDCEENSETCFGARKQAVVVPLLSFSDISEEDSEGQIIAAQL